MTAVTAGGRTLPARVDAVFDAGVVGFAVWTLCSHATVVVGGSHDSLVFAAVAALTTAAGIGFGTSLMRPAAERRTGREREDERADSDAGSRGRVGLAARGIVAALAIAAGAAAVTQSPLPVVWSLAAAGVLVACAAELFAWRGAEAPRLEPESSSRATVALVALAVACATVVAIAHRPDADDAFYLNLAVAIVEAPQDPLLAGDSLHRVEGAPLALPVYRVHAYEPAVAALARLSGRPVLDVAHLFLPVLLALFVPFVHARLARRLVPRAWLAVTFVSLGAILLTATATHGAAGFGLVRLHQGKAIVLTLLLPAVLVHAIDFAERGDGRSWVRLATTQVAALGLSASALWLAPLVAAGGFVAGCRTWPRARLVLAGAAASLYSLIVALWIRADTLAAFRDAPIPGPESSLGSVALATQAMRAVLGPGTAGALALVVAVGAWAAARDGVGRRVAAFLPAIALLLWNPFVAEAIADQLTSPATYWRVLWVLPLPALLGVALSAPASWEAPGGRLLTAGLGVALAAGAVVTTPRAFALAAANPVRVEAPGWKVPPGAFDIARRMVDATGPSDPVLAPRLVAPWIVTLSGHPTPLVVRPEYLPLLHDALGREELDRRMRLLHLVSGGQRNARSIPLFREAVRPGGLEAVALVRGVAVELEGELRANGFQKIHGNADYELWRRADGSAPGATP